MGGDGQTGPQLTPPGNQSQLGCKTLCWNLGCWTETPQGQQLPLRRGEDAPAPVESHGSCSPEDLGGLWTGVTDGTPLPPCIALARSQQSPGLQPRIWWRSRSVFPGSLLGVLRDCLPPPNPPRALSPSGLCSVVRFSLSLSWQARRETGRKAMLSAQEASLP